MPDLTNMMRTWGLHNSIFFTSLTLKAQECKIKWVWYNEIIIVLKIEGHTIKGAQSKRFNSCQL